MSKVLIDPIRLLTVQYLDKNKEVQDSICVLCRYVTAPKNSAGQTTIGMEVILVDHDPDTIHEVDLKDLQKILLPPASVLKIGVYRS